MNNTLYIPKRLNVGYCNRQDTYSGKLAYVIYWDDKGKLRKETSWQNWRDKKIPTDEIDNTPISGFVLNREVGGVRHSYSWNARTEKVRVYDPRGFEIEISIPNLLFILQEVNSIKGKGLEGDFVYAWSGPELVLLPVDSQEYKECTKYTNLQAKKVTKNDMIPGCVYKFKDNQECIYLGRHMWYNMHSAHQIPNPDSKYRYDRFTTLYYECVATKPVHVFININNKPDSTSYRTETGFTKIGEKMTDQIVDNYAEYLETFLNSQYGSKVVDVKITSKEFNISKFRNDRTYNDNIFVLFNDTILNIQIQQDYYTKNYKFYHIYGYKHCIEGGEYRYYDYSYSNAKKCDAINSFTSHFDTRETKIKNARYSWEKNETYFEDKLFTHEQIIEILQSLQAPKVEVIFESGGTKLIKNY